MTSVLRSLDSKYELIAKLSEGGMGAIYKVRHRNLDVDRVIKAALFAAAARMATYWLGGGRDPALLARAREDVRRCKRLNRSLRPPIRPQMTAFSPRFIAFFDESR